MIDREKELYRSALESTTATLNVSIEYMNRLHETIELAASIFKNHGACRSLCDCGYYGAVTLFFEQSERCSKFLEEKLGEKLARVPVTPSVDDGR